MDPDPNHFAHIIAAKSERSRWRDFFSESFTEKLIRAAGDASVHIVAAAKDPQAKTSADLDSKTARPRRTEIKACLASLAYVAAAILVAALLRQALGVSNLAQVPDRGPGERRDIRAMGLALCLSRQRSFL
jgi:two-component system, OmpR family, sensor histidine kinase KdpD